MYGSSFRIETRRPRALSSRPMLAAVIPFPREEVTPPVTKTYFATDQDLRGFFECYRNDPAEARRSRLCGWELVSARPPRASVRSGVVGAAIFGVSQAVGPASRAPRRRLRGVRDRPAGASAFRSRPRPTSD